MLMKKYTTEIMLYRVMIIQFSLLMKYFIHLHVHKLCIIRHNVTYNYFRNVFKLQVIGHWRVRGFLGGIRSQKALKVPQNIIEPFSKYEIFITYSRVLTPFKYSRFSSARTGRPSRRIIIAMTKIQLSNN